jgi:hypothetical protein
MTEKTCGTCRWWHEEAEVERQGAMIKEINRIRDGMVDEINALREILRRGWQLWWMDDHSYCIRQPDGSKSVFEKTPDAAIDAAVELLKQEGDTHE